MKKIILALSSFFILISCGNKPEVNTKSVDEKGLCTARMVMDYNGIVEHTVGLKTSLAADPMVEKNVKIAALKLNLSCKDFFLNHKDAVCSARTYDTGTAVTAIEVSAKELKANCEPPAAISKTVGQGKPVGEVKYDGQEKLMMIDVLE